MNPAAFAIGPWHAAVGIAGPLGAKDYSIKVSDEVAAKREAAARAASGGLLTAAGIAASTPAYPWSLVVAAGLAVTAAHVELVRAVLHGKRNRKQIVAAAASVGVPDAAEVPVFTARALKMTPAKLAKTAASIQKRMAKGPSKGVGRFFSTISTVGLSELKRKSHKKDASRLQIIGAVAKVKSAMEQGKEAPEAPGAVAAMDEIGVADPVLAEAGTDTAIPVYVWALGGVTVAALLGGLALALRGTKGGGGGAPTPRKANRSYRRRNRRR